MKSVGLMVTHCTRLARTNTEQNITTKPVCDLGENSSIPHSITQQLPNINVLAKYR